MKRLLILLLISLSVGACSATNSTDFSVASQYQPNTGAYALGLNAFKKNYYTVPNVAQQEFDRCVSFVLRDMQVGEQCTWEVPGNSIADRCNWLPLHVQHNALSRQRKKLAGDCLLQPQ